MKKTTFFFVFFMLCAYAFGQIPTYYNDVNLNLMGQDLKDELAVKIISTHTNFLSYTPGVWDALMQSDRDPNDPNKVLLIYGYDDTDGVFKTDRTRNKDDNGGGIGLWNREHVYPKSLGNPNLGTSGPGSDVHHLRPSDGQMNSSRSNRKFASGSGNAAITSQGHWYPGDEWKGDVARMMMYMYLRYDTTCLPSNVGIGNAVAGDANMIDLFLQWNVDDPVNAFEDNRNSALAGIQGNRNPFIDNPALATQIWGGPQAEDRFGSGNSDTVAPSIPASLVASNTSATTTMLSWSSSTDNVSVVGYDIYQDNTLLNTTASTTYNVSGLAPDTVYSFYVVAKDQAGNSSANSNLSSVTTLSDGGNTNASELFISEYVEGSSNNKALEIANFTGASVDLSAYSLKKATNGSGTFSSTFVLSGQLANGAVYVLANGNATAVILNVADATNGGVMSFNGNDAIGLFKNDVLIDKLGNENSSANYAQNVTLQRKSSITSPNTNYTVAEWDSFATNTFSGLGDHTVDGGGPAPDTTAPTVPASLVASNITQTTVDLSWNASTDDVAVTGYDVYQGTSLLASTVNTNYSVSGLTADTNYSFSVRAKDAAGNTSVSSNNTSVTTLPVPDTTAPTAPASLVASNITQTTVDLSWNASTDNVAVIGYDVYQGTSLLASTVNTNYSVSGLTADTNYSFSVIAKDAAGNTSVSSNNTSITTDAIVLIYCDSRGNNTNYEYIDFVGLGGISNSTAANGGYGDFTSQIGTVTYGSNTIVLSVGFTGSSYTENWKVWIDFNQNGTFESSEEVVSGSTSNAGNLSYNFNVPTSALSGDTRMRVSMKWNGAPTACETFSYGEVEDYTITVGGSNARLLANEAFVIDGELTDELSVFDFKVFENGNDLMIEMMDSRLNSFKVFDMYGRVFNQGNFSRKTAVKNLPVGTYVISINDGQRRITKKIVKN